MWKTVKSKSNRIKCPPNLTQAYISSFLQVYWNCYFPCDFSHLLSFIHTLVPTWIQFLFLASLALILMVFCSYSLFSHRMFFQQIFSDHLNSGCILAHLMGCSRVMYIPYYSICNLISIAYWISTCLMSQIKRENLHWVFICPFFICSKIHATWLSLNFLTFQKWMGQNHFSYIPTMNKWILRLKLWFYNSIKNMIHIGINLTKCKHNLFYEYYTTLIRLIQNI